MLLDLLVVALLSALFVPRYAEAAIGQIGEMSGRSAEVIGVGVIVLLGAGRLVPRLARTDLVRPLAARRHARAADAGACSASPRSGTSTCSRSRSTWAWRPTWTSLGYALPIALVAFTGVEIVAGLLQESANPARPLRRITLAAIAATVLAPTS